MLDTHQFSENEAWIAFQLNDAPVSTEEDGDFNVVCLMDVATGYILGNQFAPVQSIDIPMDEVENLMRDAWSRAKTMPEKLFVSPELGAKCFHLYCSNNAIKAIKSTDEQLSPILLEARNGFRAHIGGGRVQ